jgi:hypothetical protein
MSILLPTPPPGSPFRVGYDEDGRVRLSWRVPFHWRTELALFGILVGFGAFIAAFAAHIVGPVRGPVAALGVTLFFGWVKVAHLLGKLRQHRLLLEESVLRYDCWTDTEDMAAPHQLPRGAVSRAGVGAIRVVRVKDLPNQPPRPRLALDHGAGRLLLGRGLRESDLDWLAETLRAWAGEGECPAPVGLARPPVRSP